MPASKALLTGLLYNWCGCPMYSNGQREYVCLCRREGKSHASGSVYRPMLDRWALEALRCIVNQTPLRRLARKSPELVHLLRTAQTCGLDALPPDAQKTLLCGLIARIDLEPPHAARACTETPRVTLTPWLQKYGVYLPELEYEARGKALTGHYYKG